MNNVSVKYEIFPFHDEIIKSLNFQRQGEVMAFCSGTENDQLKFVKAQISPTYQNEGDQNKLDFQQISIKSIQRISANLIQWSPNDQYLASAFESLIIWQYQNDDLQKHQEFKDHELEIATISWSPDSTKIASGSLDGKIVIRAIDSKKTNEKIKELAHDNKILGLVWDTYDKYLAALYSDNNVIIWKCNSWEKSYVISLTCPISNDQVKLSSKREDRKIDWSPDYRYVLVPSLDDKIVPFVCALDRHSDFKICKTFMGPFSSINCVKFNPNLYEHKKTVINIFAQGDNDGNISIWGIGDGYVAKKPFFLFKSHPNGNELIEDICWNAQGNMLIASTLKKYVFVALFGEEVFGKVLSQKEKQEFLEGQYGSLRTFKSNNVKFKVFKANKNQMEEEKTEEKPNVVNNNKENKEINNEQQESLIKKTETTSFVTPQPQRTSVTYTQQQVIFEGGVKRIIPKKQVVVQKETPMEIEEKPSLQENNISQQPNQTQNTSEIQQSPPKDQLSQIQEQQQPQEQQQNSQIQKQPQVQQQQHQQQYVQVQLQQQQGQIQSQQQQQQQAQPQVQLQQQQQNQDIQILDSSQIKQQKQAQQQQVRMQEQSQIPKQLILKLSLQNIIPQIYTMRISNQEAKFLEVDQQSNNTILRCSVLKSPQNIKEILWSDMLEGKVQIIENINNQKIICYTSQNLLYFINIGNGRRCELPLYLANVSYLKINQNINQMICLFNNCDLRTYDLMKQELVISENINNILISNFSFNYGEEVPSGFVENMTLNNEGNPILFFKNKKVFAYSKAFKSWFRVDNFNLDIGALINQNFANEQQKISVNNNNEQQFGYFFEKLIEVNPQQQDLINKKDALLASKYEEKLLYFMKFDEKKSFEVFCDLIQNYIKKLCDVKELNKIREFLIDIFINKNSNEFQFCSNHNYDKKGIYSKVKAILEYFPFTHDLHNELDEIIQFV